MFAIDHAFRFNIIWGKIQIVSELEEFLLERPGNETYFMLYADRLKTEQNQEISCF